MYVCIHVFAIVYYRVLGCFVLLFVMYFITWNSLFLSSFDLFFCLYVWTFDCLCVWKFENLQAYQMSFMSFKFVCKLVCLITCFFVFCNFFTFLFYWILCMLENKIVWKNVSLKVRISFLVFLWVVNLLICSLLICF